jgi:hypothetical protein
MTDLLAAALEYASQGWTVFPCDQAKRPLVPGGFQSASCDPARIRQWWTQHPRALIGAAVPRSFAVLDIDGEAGRTTLAELEYEHDPLPVTLTCRTGGGGEHRYFRHPGGELRQTTGAKAGGLGVGLDTRMPGKGYVILPPSRHASGRRYRWVDPEYPPALMPAWLGALLRPPTPAPQTRTVSIRAGSRYVARALEGDVANIIGAPTGTRNATLNIAAVKLGTLVGGGVLMESEAFAVLLDAARASGYTADDGERAATLTIRSGLKHGIAHPRPVDR